MTALRRYLILGHSGETAWVPDWYAVMQAAKYLGVAPWDLLEQPMFWINKTFIAMAAEKQAQEELDRVNKQRR